MTSGVSVAKDFIAIGTIVSVITLNYNEFITLQGIILERCNVAETLASSDISSIPSDYDATRDSYRISIRITELGRQELDCIATIAEENNLKYYTTIENAQEYIIIYALNA